MLLKISGKRGVVKEYYDDDWIILEVDGHEISCALSDLVLQNTSGDAPDDKKEVLRIHGEIACYLLAKALYFGNGELNMFEVHVINNFPVAILMDYAFYHSDIKQYAIKKQLAPGETALLHLFRQEDVNDAPEFDLHLLLAEVPETYQKEYHVVTRLRPKQYITKIKAHTFLQTGLIILEKILPFAAAKDNLQVSLKEEARERHELEEMHELLQKAHLPDHIDLHAEKLLANVQAVPASEILNIQLKHARDFLEKAIRFNLHKIYLVHGHGKGVLKSEVHKMLKEYPAVKSWNTDYTPRFGHGATEVILE